MPTESCAGVGRWLRRLACIVSGALTAGAFGDPVCWEIDPAVSAIRFAAVQAGARFEGRFERFAADVCFSPDDLAASRARVTVDVASVATDNADRDQTLQTADWFEPARFPQAVFVAKSFTRAGAGFVADAELTLRDVTLPIRFVFAHSERDGVITLKGRVALERLAFGLGRGEWTDVEWVGNAVDVEVDVTARARPLSVSASPNPQQVDD